jgi:hypothetical protein
MLNLVSKASLRHLYIGKPYLLRAVACSNPISAPQYRMISSSDSSSSSDAKSSPPNDSKRTSTPSSVGNEWRKQQLDKIENKFKGKQLEALSIESEEDLQSMWKEMEGRVTKRRSRSLADTGGKSGRMNIKKTEEDVWLEEGLYSTGDGDSSKKE